MATSFRETESWVLCLWQIWLLTIRDSMSCVNSPDKLQLVACYEYQEIITWLSYIQGLVIS